MLEEKNKITVIDEDKDLNTAIDTTLAVLPVSLDKEEDTILHQIIEAPNQQELQAQFELFNLTQGKKNALRIIKLNKLLDKVEDQAIERFERRPDQVSNKEILEYMQVVSSQIDRSQKQIEGLKDKPMILVKNENTEVNVNVNKELDRDAKNRVLNAVAALMRQVQNPVPAQEDIIDVSTEPSKIINEDEEDNV